MQLDSIELAGKQFAHTKLSYDDREQVESLIKVNGGTLNSRVSAKTDYLIVNDSPEADQEPQYVTALDLNDTKGTDIKVITTTELFDLAEKRNK